MDIINILVGVISAALVLMVSENILGNDVSNLTGPGFVTHVMYMFIIAILLRLGWTWWTN